MYNNLSKYMREEQYKVNQNPKVVDLAYFTF